MLHFSLPLLTWLAYAAPAYLIGPCLFRLRYARWPVAERFPPRTFYQWMDTLLFCALMGYSAWLAFGPSPSDALPALLGAGLALWLAGCALRLWAVLSLGRHWRIGQDEGDATHHYVANGPYRFIRHPINTALIIVSAGQGLLTGFDTRACLLCAGAIIYALVQNAAEDRRWRRASANRQ